MELSKKNFFIFWKITKIFFFGFLIILIALSISFTQKISENAKIKNKIIEKNFFLIFEKLPKQVVFLIFFIILIHYQFHLNSNSPQSDKAIISPIESIPILPPGKKPGSSGNECENYTDSNAYWHFFMSSVALELAIKTNASMKILCSKLTFLLKECSDISSDLSDLSDR